MVNPILPWAAAGTALLVGIHLLAGRFHALVGPKKGRVHSVLAGITSAYLFLQVFPVLGIPQEIPGGMEDAASGFSRRLAFATAFLGFVAFYAGEVWAHRDPAAGASDRRNRRVYRLLLGTFALFNAGIAFLLPYKVATLGPWVAATYVAAIAVHLLVLDHAVAQAHGGRYGPHARAIHSAGLTCGLLLWLLVGPQIASRITPPLLAFLGGAIALQVIHEEIPAYKNGRPIPFALGAAAFSLLMILAERL